jgi:hypothetical protein
MLQLTSRKQLSKIRRQAKKRGLRVVRDHCGGFSVISTIVEPPRPLLGLDHVPLWVIEQVLFTPLPEPPPRRKRMARPTEAAPVAQVAQEAQAAPLRSFEVLAELIKAGGGAS